jgi:hypothetical protein
MPRARLLTLDGRSPSRRDARRERSSEQSVHLHPGSSRHQDPGRPRCACTHYLVFKEPTSGSAQLVRARRPAGATFATPTVPPNSRFGEPSNTITSRHACQAARPRRTRPPQDTAPGPARPDTGTRYRAGLAPNRRTLQEYDKPGGHVNPRVGSRPRHRRLGDKKIAPVVLEQCVRRQPGRGAADGHHPTGPRPACQLSVTPPATGCGPARSPSCPSGAQRAGRRWRQRAPAVPSRPPSAGR